MATKDCTSVITSDQPAPISEMELSKFITAGIVGLDELIVGAGLTDREAAYLRDEFGK